MISDEIWLAIIVAFSGMVASAVAPAVILMLNNYNVRKAKAAEAIIAAEIRAEDRKERDKVASKAAETATLLAKNTAKAAEATKNLTDKVDIVHTLVNSNLTIATQKLLEAKKGQLALLLKYEPDQTSVHSSIQSEIEELNSVIANQLQATATAAAAAAARA